MERDKNFERQHKANERAYANQAIHMLLFELERISKSAFEAGNLLITEGFEIGFLEILVAESDVGSICAAGQASQVLPTFRPVSENLDGLKSRDGVHGVS